MLQPKTAQISPTMKNGAKRPMSMLPKQRQRAGAIVREADHELCPVESAAPEFILALSCYLDESSVFPRKPFNFGLRDGVNAALGLRRPGTQCDC